MTTALVPALQSNWLVMHVTVMMLWRFISWLLISNLLFNRCFFSPRCLAQTENMNVKIQNLS
jgi:hypothetical protein